MTPGVKKKNALCHVGRRHRGPVLGVLAQVELLAGGGAGVADGPVAGVLGPLAGRVEHLLGDLGVLGVRGVGALEEEPEGEEGRLDGLDGGPLLAQGVEADGALENEQSASVSSKVSPLYNFFSLFLFLHFPLFLSRERRGEG